MQADEMDPQAKAALSRFERVQMPHSTWGLRVLRLLIRGAMWIRNRDLPSVASTDDLTIPGPDGDIAARLYRPDDVGPYPTVVFFHGGGFVLGSIATHEWLCRHLTRASGCAVLSVDYRLAPEHPFPAAVEDAVAAVEWAADHPEAVHGDGKLAVAGDSAGGTLAAVAALWAAEHAGLAVDYQVLLYPGVGVTGDRSSVTEHAGIVISEADLAWFRECYFESEIDERNPYADPTNACDLSDVAPATVVTAGFDPLRDGGRAYAQQLLDAGVPTHYLNYDAMIHGFMTIRDIDRGHDAIDAVAADLVDGLATD